MDKEGDNLQTIGKEKNYPIFGPTLVIIRGIPGCGKTYLAQALRTNLTFDNVEPLDPDLIDFSGDEYRGFARRLSIEEPELDSKIYPYRYLFKKAKQALSEGRIVVWDQPFSNLRALEKTIEKLTSHVEKEGNNLKVLIIEIEIPLLIAKERIRQRKIDGGHGPEDKALENFVSTFKSADGLGYDIVSVDGTKIDQSASSIIDKLPIKRLDG